MPIKKRGGGGESFSIEPLPTLKPIPRNPNKPKTTAKKAPPPEPKPKAEPKPAPKLTKLKRRQPMTSKYVYTDGGVLVIKTPAVTGRWDNEFRLRIIRDYKAVRSLTMNNEYQKRYVETGIQQQTYNICGKKVRVEYPTEPLTGTPTHTVVLRTDVINVTDGTRLFLNHEEPAMRVLMVYCFLTGKTLGGVPKLIVDEYPPA